MKTCAVICALFLSGCASVQSYADRHPIITTLAVSALVGSLAYRASEDYSRYSIPSKLCNPPTKCQ